MFNLFKKKPEDVKGVRSGLVQFIKETLQKHEGGEGGNIKIIQLYITGKSEQEHIYRAAVFADQPDKFKLEEVQKIADDFDISLPAGWKLDIIFNEQLPSNAIVSQHVDAGLLIITNRTIVAKKNIEALLTTLSGHTEQASYRINSMMPKMNIGREAMAQGADGFFRKNFIAFTDSENHTANKSVSRQHAHIEWNDSQAAFYIYADEGGIPPHNKMKVRGENGTIEKLQTVEMGHRLRQGDQIILGETAVLEFSFINTAN